MLNTMFHIASRELPIRVPFMAKVLTLYGSVMSRSGLLQRAQTPMSSIATWFSVIMHGLIQFQTWKSKQARSLGLDMRVPLVVLTTNSSSISKRAVSQFTKRANW